MTKSPCLTTSEAAAYLSVTPQTLARWRVDGSGPEYIKLNGKVLYLEEKIVEYLVKNTRSSTSDDDPDAD